MYILIMNNATNTIKYTETKNTKNWTQFTMTEGSDVVRQASSKGVMVDITRDEALARMAELDGQREGLGPRWTKTSKLLRNG
jgi:hypothetical protein